IDSCIDSINRTTVEVISTDLDRYDCYFLSGPICSTPHCTCYVCTMSETVIVVIIGLSWVEARIKINRVLRAATAICVSDAVSRDGSTTGKLVVRSSETRVKHERVDARTGRIIDVKAICRPVS